MASDAEQIGHYLVRRTLGRGGMGVVDLAYDPRLDREVAIKSLSAELESDTERLEKLKGEARIIAQLNHPHIVQIYQLLEHAGRTYLVLEYVPGETLADRLRREGALSLDAALTVGAQIADAMEAAHARGIVHRDLKPANVRITDEGVVKVLDFGIAQGFMRKDAVLDTPPPTDVGGTPATDRRRYWVGTPGYMAPEQARGDPPDARSDIFSFGCVLYEMLTGSPAWSGRSTRDLIDAPLVDDVDWSKLPATCPEEIAARLRATLTPDVDLRLKDLRDLRRALEDVAGRRHTPPTPTPTPTEIRTNISRPANSFVGRGGELRDLSDLLEARRLITLTGGGGCGKTRLAIELARRIMTRFPDGVYFVDLASVTEPEFVTDQVARALGIPDEAGVGVLDAIIEELRDSGPLLIVDNCEHVIESAAKTIDQLLESSSEIRIIATSREPLRLTPEQRWPLGGLTLPETGDLQSVAAAEATQLFASRARAVKPAFALDESNAGAVARICRKLDGVPLAIELAAARIHTLSASEIEARLDDRFRLLASDSRSVTERHGALRSTVEWSYRLLTECEKRTLRALAVFVGGFTVEAATGIVGPLVEADRGGRIDELAMIDLLTRLLDKSLIVTDARPGATRYRMLETIRVFALEQLEEAGECVNVCGRHLDYYVDLAGRAEPELTGCDQPEWLDRLEAEHENILAALDRCEELAGGAEKALHLCNRLVRFWLMHSHFQTGLRACSMALSRPEAQERTIARAGALHSAGALAQAVGDYDRAKALALESHAIAIEREDSRGVARAHNSLGNLAYYHGEFDEARSQHERALKLHQLQSNATGVASSLNNLANIAHDTGRLDEAQSLYERALDINRRACNRAWESINLYNLGLLAYHRNEVKAARSLLEESLAIRRELADRRGVAESVGQLGRVARRAGDDLTSARALHESVTIQRELGNTLGLCDSLDEVVKLMVHAGEHLLAARLTGAVEHLRTCINSPRPKSEAQEFAESLRAAQRSLGRKRFGAARDATGATAVDATLDEAEQWLMTSSGAGLRPTRQRSDAGRTSSRASG